MATSSIVSVKFPPDESIEWVKLAIFIDGEGHIEITSRNKGKNASCLKLSCGNTDPRFVQWAQANFGGAIRKRAITKGWKIFWDWRVNGRDAAAILEKCLPHFIMKRDQAEVALAFSKLIGKRADERKNIPPQQFTTEMYEKRDLLMFKLREVRENAAERVA